MAYDTGMIQPTRKQPAAPEIETDLLGIQQLSREHDDENWEFRSWLKQNAPHNIDGIVKALSQKYFSLIDCAVRKLLPITANRIQERRVHAIAKDARAVDGSVQETIYVRRHGKSALKMRWQTESGTTARCQSAAMNWLRRGNHCSG